MQQFIQGAQHAIVAPSDWDAMPATVQLQEDIDAQIQQQKDKQVRTPQHPCAALV